MTANNPEDGHFISEPMLYSTIVNDLAVEEGDIRILSLEVSAGSSLGDNYACDMKTVSVVAMVKGNEKKLNYVAKCIPLSDFRRTLMTKSGVFDTEVIFFKHILPRLRNLEKGQYSIPNFPRHLYASTDEGVIIMENMKLKGWYMADKLAGLTSTQLRLVLQQLARLHATSHHFINTFPGGFESFKKKFSVLVQDNWIARHDIEGNEAIARTVEQSLGGFYSSYITIMREIWDGDRSVLESLEEFEGGRLDLLNCMHKPPVPGSGMDCILHTDAWTNNFFFRNNEDGVVSEAAILDLQLMRRGRPCIDLAYLLGTSTTPEFRRQHLEEMLKMYHAELSRILLLYGYDTESFYPFSTFRAEYDECYPLAFVMGATCLQINMAPLEAEDLFKGEGGEGHEELKRRKLEMIKTDGALRERFISITKEVVAQGLIGRK